MSNGLDDLEIWVKKITEEFYELVYEDAWLKEVFKIITKEIITSQQIDFMVGAMGGPKRFAGRNPSDAHPHIFIDEEMWLHREKLLMQAMDRVNCPVEIREKWLKIDNAFKRQIVHTSPNDCKKRYFTDTLVIVPNPAKKAA